LLKYFGRSFFIFVQNFGYFTVLAEELQKWNDDVTKEPKLLVDDFKRAKFGSSEDKAEAQYELKMIMVIN